MRPRFLRIIAYLLFLLILLPPRDSSTANPEWENRQAGELLRYRYAPVETQRFSFTLRVDTRYRMPGEDHTTLTAMEGIIRVIPYKKGARGAMHLMVMLDEGTLTRTNDGVKDSIDTRPWITKRIELVIDPLGRIRQNLEIEMIPNLPIPGLAGADENGMRVLLGMVFPRLPDTDLKGRTNTFTERDSAKTRYPDKVVRRNWTERRTYKTLQRVDSLHRVSFKNRLEAVDHVTPDNFTPARITEDRVTEGTVELSPSGKLYFHERRTNLYRSIRTIPAGDAGSIEESAEIVLRIRKR